MRRAAYHLLPTDLVAVLRFRSPFVIAFTLPSRFTDASQRQKRIRSSSTVLSHLKLISFRQVTIRLESSSPHWPFEHKIMAQSTHICILGSLSYDHPSRLPHIS